MASIQRRYPTFRKQKENHCPPFFLGADRQWTAMLNGQLHFNDYEERRVTRGIEALPTTPHSTPDTRIVAKSWKEINESYSSRI
ncbi:hypothetical protein TNCV_4160351 [Trichonephila clavipes]|nr:hypothetical protein TNCV_4160351 [Trichonephila clavipes]